MCGLIDIARICPAKASLWIKRAAGYSLYYSTGTRQQDESILRIGSDVGDYLDRASIGRSSFDQQICCETTKLFTPAARQLLSTRSVSEHIFYKAWRLADHGTAI